MTYDAYSNLPFSTYLIKAGDGYSQRQHPSLMAFVYSELFRPVSDTYADYLSQQANPAVLYLEAVCISGEEIKTKEATFNMLLFSGLWMQLVQHQDLFNALLQGRLHAQDEKVELALQTVSMVAHGACKSARILILGQSIPSFEVKDLIAPLQQAGMAAEFIVTGTSAVCLGVSEFAREWSLPVQIFPSNSADWVECVTKIATHVLILGEPQIDRSMLEDLISTSSRLGMSVAQLPGLA